MNSELYLKNKNIKVTKARIEVLDLLLNIEHAVSADFIYEKFKEDNISVDLSTIYRTLELLESKNIVDKFDLGNGKYNYVLKKEVHKHILECSLCHKEIEIECPMLQIEEIIKNKTGFTLTEHELKIKGVCEECKKK